MSDHTTLRARLVFASSDPRDTAARIARMDALEERWPWVSGLLDSPAHDFDRELAELLVLVYAPDVEVYDAIWRELGGAVDE